MNAQKIEENISKLSIPDKFDMNFVYDLLDAYGKPKSSITRLKLGTYNLSRDPSEVLWKKNIFFRYVEHEDLHSTIDDLRGSRDILRHEPRFIIVTDFDQLLAADTKTQETLDIKIKELPKHSTFFLPWAGMEKASSKTENLADIKAAGRMAKLYDEIRKENPSIEPEFIHSLNVFFSRLLFCFFAEDTDVFEKGQFTNGIASHTQSDGSDLSDYLDRLFESLDKEDKADYPSHLKSFPYVNGGLFGKKMKAPKFSAQARRILLECGELNWSQINPDIFGSMIQAVVHPSQRESLGMHYTSVVNIMKVIEPLFLEELHEEFDKYYKDEKKLFKLLNRIYQIKVFDPACGSGNFLIIAYKELRKLEHKILERLMERRLKVKLSSGIKLENFYGIEIDDFAHEIAILSLWLAKHQMNQEFKELFNVTIPLVPLKDAGNIFCGNAASLDWETICPVAEGSEVFALGNPPYLGARNQKKEHKEDIKAVFKGTGVMAVNSLDYITCWVYKGAMYALNTGAVCGFVSTNSVCQGEHVSLLWPHILDKDIEIGFAHTSFKWTNNARRNAGVTCVILGIRKKSKASKRIYMDGMSKVAKNISPYLTDTDNIYIHKQSKPVHDMPPLVFGNQAIDGGHLIISESEKNQIISEYPSAHKFLKRLYGADDFLKGITRWCIWVKAPELSEAASIKPFAERFKLVKSYREEGGQVARSLTAIPYRFRYVHEAKKSLLVVPRTTTDKRDYIPVGFLSSDSIVTDAVQVVYDPEPYVMGVLSSKLHMLWVKAVAGRLESDIRYSNTLCYNNFPVPQFSDGQKDMINNHVFEILSVRENHPEKSLAELYKPQLMPGDLQTAHKDLDEVIERCHRTKPFEHDEERLEHLFKMFEEMPANKKEKTHA